MTEHPKTLEEYMRGTVEGLATLYTEPGAERDDFVTIVLALVADLVRRGVQAELRQHHHFKLLVRVAYNLLVELQQKERYERMTKVALN